MKPISHTDVYDGFGIKFSGDTVCLEAMFLHFPELVVLNTALRSILRRIYNYI